ncbi:TPA: SIR2 family protein [Legionella pneumophila]
MESWNEKNVYKIRDYKEPKLAQELESEKLRNEIEPWLTALFQSEHLSLFVGSGLTSAVHMLVAGNTGAGMGLFDLSIFKKQIDKAMYKSAEITGRGKPNIEDQIRVTNELIKGLEIYINTGIRGTKKLKKDLDKLKIEITNGLDNFANAVLKSEKNIISGNEKALEYLMSFLIGFASRSATRERLNLFTINYDRIIEFGAELSGIRLIDRFLGTINPIFRSSRLDIDMHYNPPGIRGEPRYLEGVVQFTKLHGSLDWIYQNKNVRRIALPYGAMEVKNYLPDSVNNLMIYPNSSKDRETSEYPYVELFRDFASSICRPNSTVVVYGYSFGDEHINRVIEDMLTIPSAHLVVISYNDEGDRIQHFYNRIKRPTQITLLVGNHFGDLKTLVDKYLPKPAIDKTTLRLAEILKARSYSNPEESNNNKDNNL